MQTKFYKYTGTAKILLLLFLIIINAILISCEKEEDDTKIVLESFGPMPIARGGELKFIGQNLDKVTAIVLPSSIEITTFTSKTAELVTLTVPQEAVPGMITLKTPQGDITTKTPITYSEPISIASFTPTTIKSGAELTITGDYLNLVMEVIFTDRITVKSDAFTSQKRSELKLKVPAEAQTGKIAVSNGKEDPIIVYSTANLSVTAPAFTSITPNPVKAGTTLTITGTDLDLVKSVTLGGNKKLTTFVSQSATKIELSVPADTKDGKVVLTPASGISVQSSSDLVMVVPTVSVTPTTTKNGADINVKGTNLDLIDKVIFGGDKQGTIKSGGTATEINVTIPDDAVSGVVKFITKATKEVSGPSLILLDPAIASFTPTSTKAKTDITITGANLDLVVDVMFTGGVKGTKGTQTENQLVVTIPVGAKTGAITLVAKNKIQVSSSGILTITANLPEITSFKEPTGAPGRILTMLGENLSLIKELVFPGNIYATAYGMKDNTKVEVYVPVDVTRGFGNIKILTYEGEEGITPQIYFGSTDPVKDPNLVINDFDESGHNLGWDNWSGVSLLMSDGNGVSGKYLKGNASLNAWDWKWIWGCNHSQLKKVPIDNPANYVLKLDINITGPIPDGANRFQFKLGGKDSEWVKLGIKNSDNTWSTPGWVTQTLDLVNDLKISSSIPGSGDWGMITQPPAAMNFSYFNVDNIRFEHK